MLWNSSAFTTSPTFSFLPTLSRISPLTNSSLHRTDTRTFPDLSLTPRSLRQNPIPVMDALLCFTFLVSDLSRSSTSPSVRWFPFSSRMLSSLDSTAAPHSLCRTGSSLCFSFLLSLLQSLVNTLLYDSSLSLYVSLFLFLLGPCASLYTI